MDGKEFYKLFCCDRKKAIDYLLSQDENTQKQLVNWKTHDHQSVLHQIARDGDTTYLSTILNLVDEKILNTEYVYTPLMESIINDNASVSFVLLKHPLVDCGKALYTMRLYIPGTIFSFI